LALCAGLAGTWAVAQTAAPNEEVVKPGVNIEDEFVRKTGKMWVLDFKFKTPRLITANIPGKGSRLCWYLWYQVTNYGPEPVTFVPDFQLYTHDKGMTYPDQILPAVQDAIRKVEDPSDYLKIKNSVSIAAVPIPPSNPKADPKPVTGVAIWIDPNEADPGDDAAEKARKAKLPKLADSASYSIFLAGLSNGFTLTDTVPPGPKQQVRRKTLQMSFRRFGDKTLMKSDSIRFQAPANWIYRASKVELSLPPEAK